MMRTTWRVLRLRPGDHIEVAFGSGEIGIVELRTVCRDAVEGQIVQRFRSYPGTTPAP